MFVLSNHASIVVERRQIRHEWIERTLSSPALTVRDKADPALLHALLAIPENDGRVLRVV